MPKLSIKALMGGVALVALAFCAIRDPSPVWVGTVFTAASVSLVGGILAVIGAEPGRRRRWFGYCVGGWLYWLAVFAPGMAQHIGPYLITSVALSSLTDTSRPEDGPARDITKWTVLKEFWSKETAGAEEALNGLRMGSTDTNDPKVLEAKAKLNSLKDKADEADVRATRAWALLISRAPWAHYLPGVIQPEAFTRVCHSLFAILAAWAGWFAVGWMERRATGVRIIPEGADSGRFDPGDSPAARWMPGNPGRCRE